MDDFSSRDFGSFLEALLKIHFPTKGKINRADFSRRAGFRSRSYLSELLKGKKGLSREALTAIQKQLRVPREHKRLLRLLAYRTNPRLAPKPFTIADLENEILKLRKHIRKTTSVKPGTPNTDVLQPEVFQVYAALGTEERGKSFYDMQQATRLSGESLKKILAVLEKNGAAESLEGHYRPVTHTVDFLNIKEKQQFSHLIGRVCADISRERLRLVTDDSNYLFYTALSIRSSRVRALKERLREVIFEVLDEYQDDEGDRVEQLFVALY